MNGEGLIQFNSSNEPLKLYSRACIMCRRKKIKCDRVHPCNQCVKSHKQCEFNLDSDSSLLLSLPYVMLARNPLFDFRPPKRTKVERQPGSSTQTSQSSPLLGSSLSKSPDRTGQSNGQQGHVMVSIDEFAKLKERLLSIELTITHRQNPSTQPASSQTSPGGFNGVPSPASSYSSASTSTNGLPVRGQTRPHPYLDPEETINFFEGYNPLHNKENYRTLNFGPFAWLLLLKRDKAMKLLWDHVHNISKGGDVCQFTIMNQVESSEKEKGPQTVLADGSGNDAFSRKELASNQYADSLPYDPTRAEKIRRATSKHLDKTYLAQCAQLGLTYNEYDSEQNLLVNIQRVLPKKKVIWKLIRRFFSLMYPYMPIIDELSFIQDISQVIGPETVEDTPVDSLSVKRRLDLAYLGLLLIILRLAYLLLFYNNPKLNEKNLNSTDPLPRAQEHKYLMLNPINIELFEFAKQCLDQFQFLRKFSFPVLQLAMFVRIYMMYAPEEGEICDCESQVLGGVITKMAFATGLHRDPDNFPEMFPDPKQRNLQRKMWYMIMMWDCFYACTEGHPFSFDPNFADTRPPFYEPGNENISDANLDRYVIESYSRCFRPVPIARQIASLALNVLGQVKMLELCHLLDNLDYIVSTEGTSLEDILMHKGHGNTYLFHTNYLIKVYVFMRMFLWGIYLYLFHYYGQRQDGDLFFHYLKRLLDISITDMMPHYFKLLLNLTYIGDLVFNPLLLMFIAKLNQLNCSLLIRCNIKIWNLRQRSDHKIKLGLDPGYAAYFNALCRLLLCITRAAEVLILALLKLSLRYYFSWRVSKGHTLMLRLVTSNDFYAQNALKADFGNPVFTLQQCEEVINIYEAALQKVGSVASTQPLVPNFMVTKEERASDENRLYVPDFTNPDATPVSATPMALSDDLVLNDFTYEVSEDIDKWWFNLLTQRQPQTQNPMDQPSLIINPMADNFAIIDLFSDLPFQDATPRI